MRILSLKRFSALLALLLFAATTGLGQSGRSANLSPGTAALWQDRSPQEMVTTGTRYIIVKNARNLTLDFQGMRNFLALSPDEHQTQIRNSQHIMALPMPEGGTEHFRIVESSIMEAPLQAMFPEIRTYAGQGIEDPTAYIRLDATPQGFHAMILRNDRSTVYIDPYAMGDTYHYISYLRSDFTPLNKVMTCDFDAYQAQQMQHQVDLGDPNDNGSAAFRLFGDCTKRTYRLALAATGEYTAFHGGTVALAQAAQVTTMNRVNGVYNRDMAVQLNIVANNNLIVYTNAASDPYTNGNPNTMITQNQTNCDNVIGSANYDIGHVFGTNSGGLAGLGVICSAGNKARGVTGSGAPVGDPFDIDYVAHEMGHQFGANHTFNSNQGSCSGNQNNATAMEPGSGTTIMAYAGICGAHDVQSNSDDYFHIVSLREIYTRMGATSCPVTSSIPNNQPSLTALLTNYTIPKSTPFVLTANATDADGDPITYCWEQFDNATNTQPPVATNTGGPQFRSWDPTSSNMRYIPRLSDLVTNTNYTWEVLPSVARNLRFGVYVRDNRTGGGCGDNDTMTVRVDGVSGPFVVTAPTNTGITWPATSTQTVTWNVAGTTAAPVSCANVNIYLSTDGGFTYPITLASNVPNNGSANVTVPNNPSTTCRVMVRGAGNIFFDISNNNFTITAPSSDYTLTPVTTTQSVCAPANAVYTIAVGSLGGFSNNVTMSATNVPAGGTATFSPNPVTPGNNTTMTISGTAGITPGTYTITVNGNSTTGPKSTTVTLTVANAAPAAITLNTPANAATNVSTTATLTWNAISAATYDLQIATDAGFTAIVRNQTGLTTNSWTITPALNSATTYYWRVRGVNGCGTGTWSAVRSFTTDNVVCNSYVSTTVPRTIPTTVATVWDSVQVSAGGTITDVNVTNLVGTHTYISDLRMTLIAPTGASVVLFTSLCGANDNFNIKFDDAGTAYGSIPCPMTDGNTYHPSGNLATFNGLVPTGWWKLKIDDLAAQDGGALTAWTLNICANQPPCTLTASTGSTTNVSCNGGNNGSTTVTPANGTGPYTYAWSNGANTATITNLTAGTYTVTVSGGGCSATSSATITQPSAVVTGANATATSCGLNNGAATAAGSGGSGSGYTYQWSNGGATASISNLASGTYTVTVTDGTGCKGISTVTVTSSTGISASTSNVNSTSCGLNNGSATVNGSGGSGYSYLWSNGQTTQTISNLAAGTYTVTVTSAGCTATSSAVIGGSSAVTASISNTTHTSCGLNNGAATAAGSGGSGYSYLWSNGATTQTINSLAAGTYTVTVTSAGCSSIATAIVNPSSGISASITGTTQAGCTVPNGSATAAGSGGTAYAYLWSDGQTTATATGLGAGSYTVTVTETTSGCTAVTTANVSSTSGVNNTISNTVHTSCGQNNGAATANGTGGSGSFTYLWSDGQNTQTASGLAAGLYTVTATDGGGCTSVATVQINASSAVTASQGSVTDATCGQNNGSATVTPGGGDGNYSYAWSNGQNTATATGLGAGSYTVTVTDGAGCQATATMQIQNAGAATLSTASQTNVSCFGGNNGAATVGVTGGTPNFTYAWSNGQNTATATGLIAGLYTVTVTDANGCSGIHTVQITEPAQLTASSSVTDESSAGASDGTATATPAGGTPGYTYQWSNGQTTQTATGLTAGIYTCTITDANGCTTTVTDTVSTNVAVNTAGNIGVDIYPNPSQGDFFIAYELPSLSTLEITIFNKLGQRVWETSVAKSLSGKVEVHMPAVAEGVYSVEIRSEDAVVTRKIVLGR